VAPGRLYRRLHGVAESLIPAGAQATPEREGAPPAPDPVKHRANTKNEDTFNISVRKFLKKLGVTAWSEIGWLCANVVAAGQLKGADSLRWLSSRWTVSTSDTRSMAIRVV